MSLRATFTLLFLAFFANPVQAKDFTQASIDGTYTISNVGRGGQAPLAALGFFSADGAGNYQVAVSANLPGQNFCERVFISFPESGTYTVNQDGTGTLIVPGAGNDSLFVITDAKTIDGVEVATEIQIIDGDLSPSTGNFRPPLIKRIPHPDTFSVASLNGDFSVVGEGNGRNAPDGFLGIFHFDGHGDFYGSITANLPSQTFPERQNVSTLLTGTYTVNADGSGAVLDQNGSVLFDFVISETKFKLFGFSVGKEIFAIYRQLTPETGNLSTLTAKCRG